MRIPSIWRDVDISKTVRVNEQIRSSEVMVVGANGDQLGNMSKLAALEHARESDMDLVEVAPNSKPPVCKIMDYGKFKYRQNKKAHDAKKKQKIIKVKEVKITPNTEEHDYQFKLNHARRFLADADKVKVSVFFRGRQITHSELGLKILSRFMEDLADRATVEQQPKKEGRNMAMILAPIPEEKLKENEAAAAKAKAEAEVNTEETGDKKSA
ncbi:Translation initiation factor 3 [hydrothermal vent metagenome]|uniref:Translation initiation factor 3 n=1 Tax=hydrothermal vent metagenome TaxID=652676 RepID=A0A3B1CQ72_9ZZZZ